jgi:hypothetical protein
MNVIQFPGGRSRPPIPMTTVDALIGELAAVELELARARIAQIRSETWQGNVLWTWYCCKKLLFWGFALWLICTLMAPAKAETRTKSYYDNRGSFAGPIIWNGQSWTRGNATSFSDGRGRFSGSAIRHGKWTSFYDGRGRYAGSSITTSPRR